MYVCVCIYVCIYICMYVCSRPAALPAQEGAGSVGMAPPAECGQLLQYNVVIRVNSLFYAFV